MSEDLTTLTRVKEYLGTAGSSTNDQLLARLITAVSAVVLNYVDRTTFGVQQLVDVYDGNGKDFMLIRQWPVITCDKVEVCGTVIPASPDTTAWPPQAGFVVEEQTTVGGAQQRLMLFGYAFPRGRGAVRVTYTAGYQTLGEARTVPAPTGPYTIDPANVWISDLGVTYANGTALVKVPASPAAGQYALSGATYVFAAADANAAVLISYSSAPPDVTQAVNELVGDAYRRKDRLGIVSQSVGGQETVSYSQKDISDPVRRALIPFKRVTPT